MSSQRETEQRLLGQISALEYALQYSLYIIEKALPELNISDQLCSELAKTHDYQNRRPGDLAHRRGMQELYAHFIEHETGHPAEEIFQFCKERGDYADREIADRAAGQT